MVLSVVLSWPNGVTYTRAGGSGSSPGLVGPVEEFGFPPGPPEVVDDPPPELLPGPAELPSEPGADGSPVVDPSGFDGSHGDPLGSDPPGRPPPTEDVPLASPAADPSGLDGSFGLHEHKNSMAIPTRAKRTHVGFGYMSLQPLSLFETVYDPAEPAPPHLRSSVTPNSVSSTRPERSNGYRSWSPQPPYRPHPGFSARCGTAACRSWP